MTITYEHKFLIGHRDDDFPGWEIVSASPLPHGIAYEYLIRRRVNPKYRPIKSRKQKPLPVKVHVIYKNV